MEDKGVRGRWVGLLLAGLLGVAIACRMARCVPALPSAVPMETTGAASVARMISATLTAHPTVTLRASPTPFPSVTQSPAPAPSPTPGIAFGPTIRPILPPHTATPSSSLISTPTVSPVSLVSAPAVWEQDVTLSTYGWHDALVATEPGDPVYPYPRLDFDAVTGPVPRSYRAVFIQNSFVQVVVVPELGGRILRWTDRTTGRQLFYANPVIKPTHWGYRGWWLGIGGMEWAFPEQEHGLNEYRPWQYELLGNGVRVWDVEDRTGLVVEVTIRLDGAHSYFTLVPRIANPTGEAQSYQFWANAMLALSDQNAPSSGLTFILPDETVTVHATGDGSLPGPGSQMAWPVHAGRDFGRYSEWRQYLGIFADPAQAGFVGAYDLASDQGVVRVFPHTVATGIKLFCLGDLPSDLWTDDGSRYFELWAGLTPTFWDYWTLEPGASVTWTERWYPVSGIEGYNWANEEVAVRLLPSGDGAEVAVAASHALDGAVLLRRGGVEIQRWDAHIAPGQPFHAVGAGAGSGDWGVRVLEGAAIVAQMGP